MVRNKVTALILASSLLLGSTLTAYADAADEGTVSSSVISESAETETGAGSETEPDVEVTPSPEPEQNPVDNGSTTEDGTQDPSAGEEETPSVTPTPGADISGGAEVSAETANSDITPDSPITEEEAHKAANETQAPQQTIGTPGTPAPDLSWVSPAGIRTASFKTIAGTAADGEEKISDAVRKDYKKIDPSYAIAKENETKIYEDQTADARVVGTIDKDGIMNVLKTKADYLYVESLNVRGYILRKDVISGAAAMAHVANTDLSKVPKAKTLIKLEENAAADDFKVTAYQFKEANGEDLVKYAKRHRKTGYRENGKSWDSGVDNLQFISKVVSFYNLNEADAAEQKYASYGKEVTELTQAQAGDIFTLDNGELCLYTGNDSVLLCSEEEKGVCEKSIHDVLVVSMRRPDYEKQLPKEEEKLPEDTLMGSTIEEQCWNYLTKNVGLGEVAAAGALGNIKAECGFQPGNLENWVNALMNCSDEQFTAACDSGVYTYAQFMDDRYTYPNGNGSQWGYGLIGFTSKSAKAVLWANTIAMGRSLSDLKGQLDAVAQIYGEKLFWISNASTEQAAADWFYYVGMGNPLGGTNGYGYEYTIPTRQAYAAEYYAMFHS